MVIESFGYTPNNEEVNLYTIKGNKLKAKIMNFGACLVNLYFPSKEGEEKDVVLAYESLEGYFDNPSCMGCVVAPLANRTANASFKINGETFYLDDNDNGNNLHTHSQLGAHKRLWQVVDYQENSLSLQLEMSDMELGLPGNRTMMVTYEIVEDTLEINYSIVSDKDTAFNPTNHSYFNLGGCESGSIFDHYLILKGSYFTPDREGSIPSGAIEAVKDTPFDFTVAKKIGRDFDLTYPQLALTNGYDHNYAVDNYDGSLKYVGTLGNKETCIEMEVYTTQPGVQLYTGNYVGGEKGKYGVEYQPHDGVCLETQFFPNSLNQENFVAPLVEKNKKKEYKTCYKFVNID